MRRKAHYRAWQAVVRRSPACCSHRGTERIGGELPNLRHRRQRPLHPALPTPRASSALQPELAYLPRQPRPRHLGSRPLRSPDLDLPDSIRLLLEQPRAPPPAPLRRDRPPDAGVTSNCPRGYCDRPTSNSYRLRRLIRRAEPVRRAGWLAKWSAWPATSSPTRFRKRSMSKSSLSSNEFTSLPVPSMSPP